MERVQWNHILYQDYLSTHEYDYGLFLSSTLVNKCLSHLCSKEKLKCYKETNQKCYDMIKFKNLGILVVINNMTSNEMYQSNTNKNTITNYSDH